MDHVRPAGAKAPEMDLLLYRPMLSVFFCKVWSLQMEVLGILYLKLESAFRTFSTKLPEEKEPYETQT